MADIDITQSGNAALAAALKARVEENPDTNAFTDDDMDKLAGIEPGATADQTGSEIKALLTALADTNLLTDAQVGDIRTLEQFQDAVAAMLQGGTHTNVTVVYDDEAGTLNLTASGGGGGAPLTQEQVEDFVAGVSVAGTGISVTYDDVANTLTFSLTGESYTTAEKNKLAGIEAAATADQSAEEIEAAYNSQVAIMSQAQAEAGSSTTVFRVTPQRLAQAIAALAVSLPASPTEGSVLGWIGGALAWVAQIQISALTASTPESGDKLIFEKPGGLLRSADFDAFAGEDGEDGADGSSVLSGTGAPGAGTGIDGDFYIDVAAWEIYGPKSGGTWGSGTEIVGPSGDDGVGVPAGGTAGQVLSKIDGADHNTQWTDPAAAPTAVSLNAQTGTTYTPVLADAGKKVTMDNGSANTLTIPTNASVAFPVGTIISFVQIGAGVTTILGDTGVTLNGVSAGSAAIAAQFTGGTLVKLATDTWLVEGNLAAAVA